MLNGTSSKKEYQSWIKACQGKETKNYSEISLNTNEYILCTKDCILIQRDSTSGRVFAFHIVSMPSIPGTPCGVLCQPGVIPECPSLARPTKRCQAASEFHLFHLVWDLVPTTQDFLKPWTQAGERTCSLQERKVTPRPCPGL